MDNKNIISKYDFFVTIVITVIRTSLFSYPRVLSEEVGTDGWIVIILSGLITFLFIYILCKAIEVNKYKRFSNMLQDNFGKRIGKIIALYVAASGIVMISLEMRSFTEVIKMYLLDKTPTEFIILLMILVGSFMVRGEIESIIRFNEVSFWLMFIPMALSIPFVLKRADFTNVLPVFDKNPMQYIKALRTSGYGFLGFGVIYMMLPLLKDKKESIKITFRSISFIVAFYILMDLCTLFVFSSEYNSKLLWPTITMMSSVNISGAFIERWEGIVMIFWTMFYYTTYINIYYFSSEIVRDVFNLEDIKISLVFIIPCIYVISLYSDNIAEVYKAINATMNYINLPVIGLLPLLLLITRSNKLRRVKK